MTRWLPRRNFLHSKVRNASLWSLQHHEVKVAANRYVTYMMLVPVRGSFLHNRCVTSPSSKKALQGSVLVLFEKAAFVSSCSTKTHNLSLVTRESLHMII